MLPPYVWHFLSNENKIESNKLTDTFPNVNKNTSHKQSKEMTHEHTLTVGIHSHPSKQPTTIEDINNYDRCQQQ